MKEIAYPVYNIHAKIKKKGEMGTDTISGFKFSTRDHVTPKLTKIWISNFIEGMIRKHGPRKITILDLKLEYYSDEVWFMSWFSHTSLNYYDNEEEAFKSFESWFIKKGYEFESQYEFSSMNDRANNEIGCPMGAADRYRWKFCGCDICKKKKLTIIKH